MYQQGNNRRKRDEIRNSLCVFVVITQTNSLYPFKTPVRPKYDKNC